MDIQLQAALAALEEGTKVIDAIQAVLSGQADILPDPAHPIIGRVIDLMRKWNQERQARIGSDTLYKNTASRFTEVSTMLSELHFILGCEQQQDADRHMAAHARLQALLSAERDLKHYRDYAERQEKRLNHYREMRELAKRHPNDVNILRQRREARQRLFLGDES